jgi:ribonuclease HII
MKFVIGIDEVGRGPVAGPTAVAAFRLRSKLVSPAPLRDSKKLSREQREVWFKYLKTADCDFAVTMISAKEIDRIGIAPAIRKAMAACLKKIDAKYSETILLDGSLHAPKEFTKQKTIIKGDEKEPAIGLASIVAKVTRDRYMCAAAKKFPEYGFERHVGYGTRAHYLAIKKHGMCALHRRSFLKKLA